MYSNKPIEEFSLVIDPEVQPGNHLVVFNDDVNTFDFVIDSLIEVCNHDRVQAEQCTFLIHYKGKCSVKDGEFSGLKPMCEALQDRGLSAVIE
jgi:ATP-dependent Clp protease adaptor protein ClpS